MNHKRYTLARILIVDDDPTQLTLLQRILARSGYTRVASTSDADEAMTLFREFSPDLLLLDLHMPNADGFEILGKLRRNVPESATVPVLMITGNADQATRNAALRFGARDILAKPYDVNELTLRIRNLLEIRFLYEDRRRSQSG